LKSKSSTGFVFEAGAAESDVELPGLTALDLFGEQPMEIDSNANGYGTLKLTALPFLGNLSRYLPSTTEIFVILRKEQISAFATAAASRFEEDLVTHCRQFSPRLCATAGNEAVRRTVQNGIVRAFNFGFTTRELIRFYVELMFAIGSDFDSDPQFPWAAPSLTPGTTTHALSRAAKLHWDFTAYADQVLGQDSEHEIAAVRRFLEAPPEAFRGGRSEGPADVEGLLRTIYPQKCAYLGDSLLTVVVQGAAGQAETYELPSDIGTTLLAGAAIFFGSGVLADPLYPWVAAVLKNPIILDPEHRAQRLLAKLRTYAFYAAPYLERKA
jgi:hypothetical protein